MKVSLVLLPVSIEGPKVNYIPMPNFRPLQYMFEQTKLRSTQCPFLTSMYRQPCKLRPDGELHDHKRAKNSRVNPSSLQENGNGQPCGERNNLDRIIFKKQLHILASCSFSYLLVRLTSSFHRSVVKQVPNAKRAGPDHVRRLRQGS